MYSLDNAFKELLDKIRDPDALNPAKSAPVFYFRYPPEMMLTVKKLLPRLISRIRQEAGRDVRWVSLADVIWDIVDKSGRWDIWLNLESDADACQINEAVRDLLRQGNSLINRVSEAIASAPEGTIVFLTEAELLHPYLRTRVIEEYVHNKAAVCTIIFYPGERSGQFGLKFLGFYKEDSRYRSTIIGSL
ncbi:MAG: BREX protein BrxB domain-containing protein [Thermodesulfobacteriota bacterium]